MKVFVVIAVHNRKDYTLNCLSLLQKQSYQNFELIVVDDGSSDGTSSEIKKHFPNTRIINGDGTWWWSKSMNEGFKLAYNEAADLLISLNNDTSFNADLIQHLVALNSKYPKHLIGCLNMVQKEKAYVFFSGIKRNIWWKAKEVKYHKAFSEVDEKKLNGLHQTTCLNGRGTLIPRSVFEKIGFLDALSFPQYASDYDFTLRASQAGFPAFISWDNPIVSFIEETGQGKSFVNNGWIAFLKSFFNPYSSTSLRMWLKYYLRHGGIAVVTGLPCQVLRQMYSFRQKRNLLEKLK